MSDFIDMQERISRLDYISSGTDLDEDKGLLKTFNLHDLRNERLVFALNYYLYTNLCSWYKDSKFVFSNNMLEDYPTEIMALPNITPNGLILPKVENSMAYNLLHAEFAQAFSAIGMNDKIDSIQYPINIRIKQGLPNPEVDARPLSSTKPHTDIWAGDSGGAMLVFLSLLGDPDKAGINFFYAKDFPKEYACPLKDYVSGEPVIKTAEHLPATFKNGKWFMIDSYLIHQTTKKGAGLRISMDLRFMPKKIIASDTKGAEERLRFFCSFEKWLEIGKRYWVSTKESMSSPVRSEYDFKLVDCP